jgi:hypothetical protein
MRLNAERTAISRDQGGATARSIRLATFAQAIARSSRDGRRAGVEGLASRHQARRPRAAQRRSRGTGIAGIRRRDPLSDGTSPRREPKPGWRLSRHATQRENEVTVAGVAADRSAQSSTGRRGTADCRPNHVPFRRDADDFSGRVVDGNPPADHSASSPPKSFCQDAKLNTATPCRPTASLVRREESGRAQVATPRTEKNGVSQWRLAFDGPHGSDAVVMRALGSARMRRERARTSGTRSAKSRKSNGSWAPRATLAENVLYTMVSCDASRYEAGPVEPRGIDEREDCRGSHRARWRALAIAVREKTGCLIRARRA